MTTFSDAYQKVKQDRAAKQAAIGQGTNPTDAAQSQSADTTQWSVRGVKLGASQTSVGSAMQSLFHSPPKIAEGQYKTRSGAFTSTNVVLSQRFSANAAAGGAPVDESGMAPNRAQLDIGYTWPTPGAVFAAQYTSRYDDSNYNQQNHSYDALPKLQTVRQAFFSRLGSPAFAQEAPISGRILPANDALGGWNESMNAGAITWIWTAGSDYKAGPEFQACTEARITSSELAWMRGNRSSTDIRAPQCGQFLRIDIKRVDVEHVYALSVTMIDQKSYADMSGRFEAYLNKGDASAQAATADIPQIGTTPLAKLFTKFPYDGTPNSYFPRIAITVTDWNRPNCWFAKATLWSSPTKSESVGPFSTCWGGANFNWKLQSAEYLRVFEAQKPNDSSGNVRSKGPKPPLRASVDTMPADASGAYNDFVHAVLGATGWQEGAPTNIWIAGFAAVSDQAH